MNEVYLNPHTPFAAWLYVNNDTLWWVGIFLVVVLAVTASDRSKYQGKLDSISILGYSLALLLWLSVVIFLPEEQHLEWMMKNNLEVTLLPPSWYPYLADMAQMKAYTALVSLATFAIAIPIVLSSKDTKNEATYFKLLKIDLAIAVGCLLFSLFYPSATFWLSLVK